MTAGQVCGPLRMHVALESWPLAEPFTITGRTWVSIETIRVDLETQGCLGSGEAAGVYYRQETPQTMAREIEQIRARVEKGIDRRALQDLLPAGGARNALDCALWDLDAKLTGRPVWKLAELEPPRPLLTTFTCGAADPDVMAEIARGAYAGAHALKLKLTGEAVDAERVRAVRAARPEVWLGIDANEGFDLRKLHILMPTLVDARVELIEQPFPVGQESWLDGLCSPIRIAADESVQGIRDLELVRNRFQVVNIKLDKCGGLTEALSMARLARSLGLDVMVGNMLGTSLAMCPAFLVGQLCDVADLDGPLGLKSERPYVVQYLNGRIECPEEAWGYPAARNPAPSPRASS